DRVRSHVRRPRVPARPRRPAERRRGRRGTVAGVSPSSSGRAGITIPFEGVALHAHREWYARLRDLGYTDLWSAEVDGADGFTPLALAAAWGPSLNLGVARTPG